MGLNTDATAARARLVKACIKKIKMTPHKRCASPTRVAFRLPSGADAARDRRENKPVSEVCEGMSRDLAEAIMAEYPKTSGASPPALLCVWPPNACTRKPFPTNCPEVPAAAWLQGEADEPSPVQMFTQLAGNAGAGAVRCMSCSATVWRVEESC